MALNNESIRVAVKDYLEGGEKRDVIVKIYGPIEDWDTSKVNDMRWMFYQADGFNFGITSKF